MAVRYNMRPQSRDQDTSSYAALPGTAQTEFVPHNMTPMKMILSPEREVAGCHPSRWIYELINSDFTACDMFERARRAKIDSAFAWDHRHKLVLNGNQSYSTRSTRVLSAVCLDCNFHFVFKMVWDAKHGGSLCHPSQALWPLRDNQFPWHHLAWAGSGTDAEIDAENCKYYPLLAREHFVCSAPPCTFQLTLEVSEPRMPAWWVKLLLDHDAIREQLRVAREQEPGRYEGATDDWASQAPINLNTYLKNLLESGPDNVRTISKHNKRFAVLFGPRCFSIFQRLEFAEQVVDHDGVDEGSFTPTAPSPATGPSGTTEMSTYRAYLEDVRTEVQCLIHAAGQASELPTYCAPLLHADLRCQEVPNVGGNALVAEDRYKLLGVLPTQPRDIIVSAYKRQWELLPTRRRALVESLMAVANDSGDELLSDYAITQSSVFDSQLQHQATGDDDGLMSQALSFLGLQPPNNHTSGSVIEAFRRKLARDLAEAGTARSMLMLIARASTDESYQAALLAESEGKMSVDTANAVLGLTPGMPWQEAAQTAKNKLERSKGLEEASVYLDALDAIADFSGSDALRRSVAEMRRATGLSQPDSGDSRAAANGQLADLGLPVGLHNIGNTCYLNSLLQYLFTVKPILDIVLNYDESKLDLTDESIKSRLLGGNKMQMDRGEAIVAQAFVRELATLFRNLQSSDQAATLPSQRLANAVLLSTHTLLNSSKQASEQGAAPQPPPLPARPSPAPPAKSTEDVEMTAYAAASILGSMDTASNSSSRTLVDQEDARSDRSYEKVDTAAVVQAEAESAAQDEDVKMTDNEQTAEAAAAATATTTTPPGKGQETSGERGGDVCMDDTAEVETVDQKVLNALEHQKRSSGTDQQDVEEVMGSILNRLQAAIRPSSVDEKTGIQLEKIMETFFVTTVNYTKKFEDKTYQHEVSFDRSITAFPAPDGPCSLYEALGRNFDQQILEESKLSRYTAIRTLPPVLHVLIQRSQSMGSKNGNAVVIPEILYLDRYMDAPHDSPVFRRRVEDWAIANRIADLKSQLAVVEANPSYMTFLDSLVNGLPAPDGAAASGEDEEASAPVTAGETWDFDGPVEDDFFVVTPTDKAGAAAPRPGLDRERRRIDVRETHEAVRGMMEKELRHREKTLEEHVESMKKIAYRLHAVICHRGQLVSGHYWVWICDFEERVWRRYNDADVRESRDTAEVLQTLSTSGEPYYLCYVRDEDKTEYVKVPKRQAPATPPTRPRPAGDTGPGGDAGPSAPRDADEGGAARPKYRIE